MFGNKRERSSYGSHGRPSARTSGSRASARHTSSRRHRDDWSSSVVGTHTSNARSSARKSSRDTHARKAASGPHLRGRAGEINQVDINARSVQGRMHYQSKASRTEHLLKRRTYTNRIFIVAIVVVVVAVAFALGTCAFRGSLSSSMALNDESVSNALVAQSSEEEPYYILISGIANEDTAQPTASFMAVMRVDAATKTISLLNIPSSMAASYSGAAAGDDMLRDAPHAVNEGELIKQVSSLIDHDINHYLRITEENFVTLVNSLGGLTITVDQYVDDPTVGTIVLDPGEQTLSGEQALTYVSAKNYSDGFGQRAAIQTAVLEALIAALQEKGGIEFAFSADNIAGLITTDMDYDTLSSLASLYSEATVYTATVPGKQVVSGESVYWSKSSDWTQVLDEFKAGEDMDTSVDTSGVDKSALSIVVLNGAGTDGYSAQAAQVLTDAGYTIKETGNANSFVYNETLVIYAHDDDKVAAEAIVQDLGVGRAVPARGYYSLKTDIQVVVGKDWTPRV